MPPHSPQIHNPLPTSQRLTPSPLRIVVGARRSWRLADPADSSIGSSPSAELPTPCHAVVSPIPFGAERKRGSSGGVGADERHGARATA